jgi:hypothetical protein
MMRRHALRQARLAHAAVGATIIAVPASAAALAEAATTSQPGAGAQAAKAKVRSRRIPYGRDVVVTGTAPSGQEVTLSYSPDGASGWRALDSSPVAADGRFRLAAPLRRSGAIRVSGSWQQADSPEVTASRRAGDPSDLAQRITVLARLHLRRRALHAFGARSVHVRGRLMPGSPGRRVRLQALEGGRWHTVAVGRTGGRGAFDLRFAADGAGSEPLRVAFAGDRLNGAVRRRAGILTMFRQSVASWYEDGGSTACGFHAYYGVANRTLPCGTHVTFAYGGRTVQAVVDDRGPFVSGREWDLNQNTAGALGFGGVGSVWSSR